MEGRGVLMWPSGKRYVGEFEKDKRQGKGVYYWSDGRMYDGEWRNGK